MNDLINSLFELMGCIFILNHCLALYKDKMVRGVSLTSTVGFFTWGLWNVYYYPSLGQSFSYYAGIGVCLANALWVGLMIYYKKRERITGE